MPKKKISYRVTRYILQYFSFYLRIYVMRSYKDFWYRFKKLPISPSFKFYRRARRNARYVKQFPKAWRFRKPREIENTFFYNMNRFYKTKRLIKHEHSLLAYWRLATILRRRYRSNPLIYRQNSRVYFSTGRRLPRIKRQDYLSSLNIQTVAALNFYCFKNIKKLADFKLYLSTFYKRNRKVFGLESTFLVQAYRANIFPTTRYCYLAIKLGYFYLNSTLCKNPHKLLSVFDTFRVREPFLKRMSNFFLLHLLKKRVPLNAPNYLDCNYNIFSFHIWRKPTSLELRMTEVYPFQKQNPTIELLPSKTRDWSLLKKKKKIF